MSHSADVEFFANTSGEIIDGFGIDLATDHTVQVAAQKRADFDVRVAGDFDALDDVARIDIAFGLVTREQEAAPHAAKPDEFHDNVIANGLPELKGSIQGAYLLSECDSPSQVCEGPSV